MAIPLCNPPFTRISPWSYRETGAGSANEAGASETQAGAAGATLPGVSEEEVNFRIAAALQQARSEWEEFSSAAERKRQQKVMAALLDFAAQRSSYFRHVESEVVHLALAIVRKILQREASVDPTLLFGLVRIALEDITAGSTVRLRVPPAELAAWTVSEVAVLLPFPLELVEDSHLESGDAVLETNAGRANIGFEPQLKQIEQGFFDLLAHRPEHQP